MLSYLLRWYHRANLTRCVYIDIDGIVWLSPSEGLLRGSISWLLERRIMMLLALQTLTLFVI